MLLKISPDTIVETDQIELIADRGDGKLSLHLRGGERVAYQSSLSALAEQLKIIALDATRAGPVSAIVAIRARGDGLAMVETIGGLSHTSRDTFAAIATAAI